MFLGFFHRAFEDEAQQKCGASGVIRFNCCLLKDLFSPQASNSDSPSQRIGVSGFTLLSDRLNNPE